MNAIDTALAEIERSARERREREQRAACLDGPFIARCKAIAARNAGDPIGYGVTGGRQVFARLLSDPRASKENAAKYLIAARNARRRQIDFDTNGKWVARWLDKAARARREAKRRNEAASGKAMA